MDESKQALNEWADQIAALEPDVVKGIRGYAEKLAGDKRLSNVDREFAAAQADAIRRAVRRFKSRQREPKNR